MPITERADLDFANLSFSLHNTDVNVRYTWRDGKWDDGVETDSELLPVNVAATCLHYGQAIFEGLKVYEAKDGRVLSFRSEENAKRMQRSAEILLMQAVLMFPFCQVLLSLIVPYPFHWFAAGASILQFLAHCRLQKMGIWPTGQFRACLHRDPAVQSNLHKKHAAWLS